MIELNPTSSIREFVNVVQLVDEVLVVFPTESRSRPSIKNPNQK